MQSKHAELSLGLLLWELCDAPYQAKENIISPMSEVTQPLSRAASGRARLGQHLVHLFAGWRRRCQRLVLDQLWVAVICRVRDNSSRHVLFNIFLIKAPLSCCDSKGGFECSTWSPREYVTKLRPAYGRLKIFADNTSFAVKKKLGFFNCLGSSRRLANCDTTRRASRNGADCSVHAHLNNAHGPFSSIDRSESGFHAAKRS